MLFERDQPEPEVAMRREKSIKRWRRDWKIEMIEKFNPTWRDLFENNVAEQGYAFSLNSRP